jgi:hypothetical protein
MVSAPAGADIVSPPAPSAASQGATFSFQQLGLAQSYSFQGSGTSVGIILPVPENLQPSVIVGTLIVPPDFGTGTLVVSSGTTYVSSFSLPANSGHQQLVPFFVSVANAPIANQTESLNLSVEQAAGGGALQSTTCSSTLPLKLINPNVGYSGSFATPTTIANFFPPVLTNLVLYVPNPFTTAEATAALNVAATAADSYQLVPMAVAVKPWDGTHLPDAPTGPLARAIVINQSNDAVVRLSNDSTGTPLLVMSGSAVTLPEQTTLLSSAMAKVIQSSSATVLKSLSTPTIRQSQMTFSQLGITGTATFSGQQQLNLNVNESMLGGVATSMAVNLLAQYTPVEPGAKGSVDVTSGGVELGTQALDGSGKLDMQLNIPGPLIVRSTPLLLTASYFPAGFHCGGGTRTMTFTIDPRSTVTPTFTTGGTGGFPALPQSLLPTFDVAFDQPSANRLNAAVSTLCGLQRLSSVLLHPIAVPMAQAIGGGAPVLVVSDAANVPRSLHPPLEHQKSGSYKVNDASSGQFQMGGSLASLQAFADPTNHRTVLLASTSGGWPLMDTLFAWLGNTAQKWLALTGDVLAVGPGGTPANVAVDAGGTPTFAATSANHRALFIGIGILFLLALLALITWALLRRRAGGNGPTEMVESNPTGPEGSGTVSNDHASQDERVQPDHITAEPSESDDKGAQAEERARVEP